MTVLCGLVSDPTVTSRSPVSYDRNEGKRVKTIIFRNEPEFLSAALCVQIYVCIDTS